MAILGKLRTKTHDMKNEKILISYRAYIPKEVIAPFHEKFNDNEADIVIDKKMYFNASGDAVADIIVYIGQISAEAIVQGIMLSTIYDALKYSIKTSWTAYRNYFQSKQKTKFDEGENRCIAVNFSLDEKRTIEYRLTGDISDDVINNLTDKIFSTIKDQTTIKQTFSNPDLVNDSWKPKIRMKYNSETKEWEPVNFGDIRKYFEKSESKLSGSMVN